jgi:hypothetical protein
MLRRFAFAALLVSGRMATAASGPVPDFVPPATRAVIGFHLRSVIDSALVQGLGADLFKNAGASWTASTPIPGIDPLKDLDEVVIASTMEGDHPPSLVICRGRFAVEEIGKGAEVYKGVPIRKVQDGDAIALLDASTIVAGSMKDVRAAIDRRESPTAGLNAELVRRAGELSGRYAIWGVGTLPADFHPPAGGPEALNSLDRFDFGVALSHGLELAATLHVRKPEDAQKLSAAMQFVEMMSKAQPDNNGTKIETHVENGTLTVALEVSEEALKKGLEQQHTMIAQAIANAQTQAQKQAKTGMPARPVAQPSAVASPGNPLSVYSPAAPSKETKIISDQEGVSVKVTLPGKR